MKITDSAIRQAVTQWPMIVRSCPGYAWSWGHHNMNAMLGAMVVPPLCLIAPPVTAVTTTHKYCQVEPYVDRPKSDRRWDKPGAGRRAITEVRW